MPEVTNNDLARDLARAVVVYDYNIRARPFTWHGGRSAGFVGTVTFGVPRTGSTETRKLFATLNRLAALSGVGHGTTHGLGAVHT